MEAKEILNIISEEDIINIMSLLGSGYKEVNDGLLFKTVCHNGEGNGKHKLHYHSKSKTFYCYTQCGNIGNIFNLIKEVRGCNFKEAYNFVCESLGINSSYGTLVYGFREEATDNSFIQKFTPKPAEEKEKLKIRDKGVLKEFWRLYHQSWIDDYISKETMEKFNIQYDVLENAIIIPHFDKNNKLIGIRARNLNQELIDEGRKYMPIFHNGELYNYPTGLNLFGLNITKRAIKKHKKVIIGESEKFVMQHYSFYGKDSVAVALGGSALSEYQVELLKELGVERVILALDKEFSSEEEAKIYAQKIKHSFISKLYPFFTVEIIWDNKNVLGLKDAPTDAGKEVFEELYRDRMIYEG